MGKHSEIKQLIRSIASTDGGATLFEATVVESKDTECTIKYQGLEHKNVRLVCGFSQSLTTVIVKPAPKSTVLVADLSSGKMRDLVVLMVEKAETVTINGGNETITINGGELGGLINIAALTDKLNALVNKFNTHTHAVIVGEMTGTAKAFTTPEQKASTFKKSDYEDTKIKH